MMYVFKILVVVVFPFALRAVELRDMERECWVASDLIGDDNVEDWDKFLFVEPAIVRGGLWVD